MMTRRQASTGILASAALAATPTVTVAQALKPLDLPPPRREGGQPLTTALKLRRSTREYSDRPLPVQVLSDLLWAAFGVNRPSGDRTAPYWRHIMVIDIYVAHGERMTDISAEARRLYASVDTGFIGQNVYLFCASEGLATVFRGAVDYPKLTRTLQLPDQQFVTFAQTVGYPRA